MLDQDDIGAPPIIVIIKPWRRRCFFPSRARRPTASLLGVGSQDAIICRHLIVASSPAKKFDAPSVACEHMNAAPWAL
jgi:hypothetical protein